MYKKLGHVQALQGSGPIGKLRSRQSDDPEKCVRSSPGSQLAWNRRFGPVHAVSRQKFAFLTYMVILIVFQFSTNNFLAFVMLHIQCVQKIMLVLQSN